MSIDKIFSKLSEGVDLSHVDSDFKEHIDSDSILYKRTIEDFLPPEKLIIQAVPRIIKIHSFLISNSVLFIPFDEIFPECGYFNRENTTPRLACLADFHRCSCTSDICIRKLIGRIEKISAAKSEWKLFVMYWRLYLHNEKNKDRRFALCYWPEVQDFMIIPINSRSLHYFINRRSKKIEIELGLSS